MVLISCVDNVVANRSYTITAQHGCYEVVNSVYCWWLTLNTSIM